MSESRLDRTRISDQIFRELRDDIVSGVLRPGDKLPAERELAQRYQVSNPTVREALRGLTLLGLVDVRHGSGAYVTGDTAALIAMSLGAVIQLSKLDVNDVLNVLGLLNENAACLAADVATPGDHARLRATLIALERADTVKASAEAVRDFHGAIAAAAHNPLLAALYRFLTDVQIELGLEMFGDTIDAWRKVFTKLKPVRGRLIAAIIRRDREATAMEARDFNRMASGLITSLPKAQSQTHTNDPMLRQLLSIMMARAGRPS